MSGRKRYIAVGNKWVEVSDDFVQPPVGADHILWNDRSYQDANDPRFSSRTQHKEFMKANNLTTIDDFSQHFQRAAKQRAEFFTTGGKDPSRVEAVKNAVAQHYRRK